MITSLHFIRPYFLLLLLTVPPLLMLVTRNKTTNNAWANVCDPHLLPYLLIKSAQKASKLPLYLLAAGWIISIVALAGPSWKQQIIPGYQKHTAHVIVLDLSQSMFAEDLQPTRLNRAKFKIIDMLKHNRETLFGLVVFSSKAYLVSPLTDDGNTIISMVDDLSPNIMPSAGNNIAAGLNKAAQLLQQAGETSGHIILLADSKPNASAMDAAKMISQVGYTISVIGVGTPGGGPISLSDGFVRDEQGNLIIAHLPEKALSALASAGDGRYHIFTNDDSDLKAVLKSASNEHIKKSQLASKTWQDEGRYLVFALLVIALFAFRRGWYEHI